jgi:hypothetical protein
MAWSAAFTQPEVGVIRGVERRVPWNCSRSVSI